MDDDPNDERTALVVGLLLAVPLALTLVACALGWCIPQSVGP